MTLLALPHGARAQLIEQYYPAGIPGYQNWFSDAVMDRPRSEYDPLGLRAGSFIIRPSLSESLGYDSNVFGSPRAAGSALAITQGSVAAASDWSRDKLDAAVGFADQRDLQYPGLSHTDWTASIGGSLDVGTDRATAAYTHFTATTAPVQIGTLTTGQPITLTFDGARANYQVSLGRFTLEPAIDVRIYRFASVLPGSVNETTNDRNSVSGSLTASYELAPGSSLVAVARDTDAAYLTRVRGEPTPNYNDASLVGGLDFRGGAMFRTRALIGFEQRSYVDARLPGTSAPLAELDLIWTPTRLTTVTGQVSHSLQNAIEPSTTESYAYSTARLVVDHEYLRNVLLQAFGQFQAADYQLHSETQHVLSAGASVTWLLNRKLSVVGRFTYTRSTDNVDSSLNEDDSLAELTLDFRL